MVGEPGSSIEDKKPQQGSGNLGWAQSPSQLTDAELSQRRDRANRVGAPPESALADWILFVAVSVAIGGVAVQTVAHGLNAAVFDHSLSLLDADTDPSVFAWASSAATVAGVPGAVLLAAIRREGRIMVLALSIGLCFFSLDDALEIHERVAELDVRLGLGASGGRVVWPIVYLPLLGLTFVVLLRLSRTAPPRVARALCTGLFLLVAAVALEVGSYALVLAGFGFDDWPFVLEIVLEEGAELGGWVLCAGAITASGAAALLDRGAAERESGETNLRS